MRICVIGGDGIGPEVLGAALRVLHAVAPQLAVVQAEAGWRTFEQTGVALPETTLQAAREADAVLFGAVASPSHPVASYRSPIVALRRTLDLYANIRPVDRLAEPSSIVHRPSSMVVVRENTEDLYAGRERLEDGGDTAIAERVITRRASERIARVAFELARQRGGQAGQRPKVTIVHKANVLRLTDGLFRAVALGVAEQYPDVAVEELLVDTAAMHLARSPERFDVLVTTNMFGDILSDIACIHGGGLGLASSANLGDQQALFEPVHGAAPDIAGEGIANPLAAISCVALLLEWYGQRQSLPQPWLEASQRVAGAVRAVLSNGPRTPDIGGSATTDQVTEAIIQQL